MDNKNEKTFTDLFLSSKIDDDIDTGITTFDSLVNEIFEKEEGNDISFNDIKNINEEEDVSLGSEVNIEENTDFSFGDGLEGNTDLFSNEEKIEDVVEENVNSNYHGDVKEEVVNPFFDDTKSEDKEEDISSNYQGDVKEEVVNPFFDDTKVEDKEEDISSNYQGDVKEEVVNPFFDADKKEDKIEDSNKLVFDSVSPFFQETGFDKEQGKLFEFDNINLDETKNINSNAEKLDLSNSKHFNVKVVKKKEPLLKFIMGVISYSFFIFLMLMLIALLVYVLDIKIRASKGDYSAPKINAYVVLTGSMLPDIKVKDVVVTKRVDTNELEVRDIITFASSDSRYMGTIITHRIIKKNLDSDGNITFQTKGDNNNVADSALVYPNNIYGKVILKIPKLGYLQDFLATKGGWIIVILIPCLTVISYDIVKLSKGLKRKKNKIIIKK